MGKGDTYRPVDKKKYDANYERIFGKKRKKKRAKSNRPRLLAILKKVIRFKNIHDESTDDGDGHFDTWQSDELKAVFEEVEKALQGEELRDEQKDRVERFCRRIVALKNLEGKEVVNWLIKDAQEILDNQ